MEPNFAALPVCLRKVLKGRRGVVVLEVLVRDKNVRVAEEASRI
jgi:hypothetical protein